MDVPAGIAINAYNAELGRSQPPQERDPGGKHGSKVLPDAKLFKDQLESCLGFFRGLIDTMVRSTKESAFAGLYFHPIIRQLDNHLVRLEIWASDVGANEPDFGSSPRSADIHLDLDLTRYITTIMKDLQSHLEESGKYVEEMRSLIGRLSGIRLKDLNLDRKLRTSLVKVDKECQEVALAIRNIVSLTEAFQMEQAVKLQSGPLAGIHQQHLQAMGNILETSPPSPAITTGEPSAGSIEVDASEDQGPWRHKILLSLDGGGTRNISTILILRALMVEIAVQEQELSPQAYSSAFPLQFRSRFVNRELGYLQRTNENMSNAGGDLTKYLPCHYFDYMIGTNFGGLIAVMLSRLRMNVEECLAEYQALLDPVWSHPRFFSLRARTFWPREKYNHDIFESGLKDMVSRYFTGNHDTALRQQNDDICRCIVTSVKDRSGKGVLESYLFRSYHHEIPLTDDPSKGAFQRYPYYAIWEVVRATTAAPTYFAPMRLREGLESASYLDGALININPSVEGSSHVREVSGEKLGLVISIGSGASREVSQSRSGVQKYRGLPFSQDWALNAETAHQEMKMMQSVKDQEISYYDRFNVEENLGGMALDEWKGKHGRDTLRLIHKRTKRYLDSESVKSSITKAAQKLVEIRRARASTDHWESFCHGVEYACPVIRCKDGGKTHRKRKDLRHHLEDAHRIDSSRIETVLDQGKRFPFYSHDS